MLRNVNNTTVLNGDQVTYNRNVFGRTKRTTARVYFLFRTVLNSLN